MEIPYMEKLQEHFANDKRITLISISWDYTQKVWLDYLKKRPATWPQYMVDKENMDVMKRNTGYRVFHALCSSIRKAAWFLIITNDLRTRNV